MLICICSFYPVLHVAERFFLKIVKMWVVHDAIHIVSRYRDLQFQVVKHYLNKYVSFEAIIQNLKYKFNAYFSISLFPASKDKLSTL